MFKTSGSVSKGRISAIDISDTLEDVSKALLIGTPPEIIDKVAQYREVGLDEVAFNMAFGISGQETFDSMQRFAEEVMPHFITPKQAKGGAQSRLHHDRELA
jgi:hypothetical protein